MRAYVYVRVFAYLHKIYASHASSYAFAFARVYTQKYVLIRIVFTCNIVTQFIKIAKINTRQIRYIPNPLNLVTLNNSHLKVHVVIVVAD